MPLAANVLSLERKQAGLETDATAAEQDQKRRDRWGCEDRQCRNTELSHDHELEGRKRGARADGDDDTRCFLDGRVLPDRSVEPCNAIGEQLGGNRKSQHEVEDGLIAELGREVALVSGKQCS